MSDEDKKHFGEILPQSDVPMQWSNQVIDSMMADLVHAYGGEEVDEEVQLLARAAERRERAMQAYLDLHSEPWRERINEVMNDWLRKQAANLQPDDGKTSNE